TVTVLAPLTTWALVRMYPSGLMMIPVPSPVSRRLWATMSTTDGSTLARMPFTSRAAPDSAGAEAPEPEAGTVVGVVPDPGHGIGGVVAPPEGAVAGVTAGESVP